LRLFISLVDFLFINSDFFVQPYQHAWIKIWLLRELLLKMTVFLLFLQGGLLVIKYPFFKNKLDGFIGESIGTGVPYRNYYDRENKKPAV
jgi:hypothetical protein